MAVTAESPQVSPGAQPQPLPHCLIPPYTRQSRCSSIVTSNELLVVVRICWFSLVFEEESGAFCGADVREGTSGLGEIKEPGQIRFRPRIGEIQPTRRQAEVVFNEFENAAEVVAVVVDQAFGGIGRHNE